MKYKKHNELIIGPKMFLYAIWLRFINRMDIFGCFLLIKVNKVV
jgi:hypothetical protein